MAALVGPTAVGKTELSLDVAERLDAEIVSLDSMQIYTGMDIGTAKASVAERERVPHHLIDVRDPAEEVSVAEFRDLAREAISDIHSRGRLPLLVGGSGLYLRAVVDDLNFPPTSADLRVRLESEEKDEGVEVLYERLQELDPHAAAKIEPGNSRRIIRALEVIELTGRPFSSFADVWDRYESVYELRVAGLTRPREELYERIVARVMQMIEAGLADETEELRGRIGRTASQALGYRQFLEASPGEDGADAIVRATKRFARRQESWFRADPRIEWFDARGPALSERVAGYLSG